MSGDNDLIKTLLKSIQETNEKQTKEIKCHIDKEVQILKNIIQDETNKRTRLETQYNELKNKYQNLEKALRKNNIIIFGLHNNTEKSLVDFTIETLNKYLDINLIRQDINNIYTIGKKTHDKPIIVKLVSFIRKIEILKATPRLKGTKISIAEELTVEERQRNKILKQNLKSARAKGLKAYIKYNKLYVNDEEFTIDQLLNNETEGKEPESESEEFDDTKDEDNIETIKSNSAPPTPTHINKINLNNFENVKAPEEQIDALDTLNKKKKIYSVQQRSSPRLLEIEKMKK